jgi:type IV pilus assembly protein PilA
MAGQASYPKFIQSEGKRMGFLRIVLRKHWHFVQSAAATVAIFLAVSPCSAQSKPESQQPETPWSQLLKNHPGLLDEFGRLYQKLQQSVQFPPPRSESRILPLLPPSTISYAAFPNYGDVTQQALKIFRQELQDGTVLRDWWQQGDMALAGPKIEDSLEELVQFQQYLGEEIVVSGSLEGQDPKLLVVAEIRKPGLKKFLQETITHLGGESKQGVHVLDLQDLAAAKDDGFPKGLILLVRPDYAVAATDLSTLRKFNSRLERHGREFASTPFAQRVAKEYAGGVTVLAAADLHKIIDQAPSELRQGPSFQRSGFADVKYLIWEHKIVGTQTVSQTELSFNAPRHNSAAWLANSGPLTGFDFVSPKAMIAGTALLANPAQIIEDVKGMYTNPSTSPFASLPAFEKMLNLSLKDDLLNTLGGEVTLELDSLAPPKPVWKAILSVRDTSHLQQTLTTLLTAAHIEAEKFDEEGVAYSTVHIPTSTPPLEITYAFVDRHLILGSSRETVAEAVRMHKEGETLAKSKAFLAALPTGHPPEASAMLYQDPVAIASLQLRAIAPEMVHSLAQSSKEIAPAVVSVYGDESTIREASNNGAYDFGAVTIVAAIAIPNLLRSRMAANEASAVGSLRTVNVAQVTYAAKYPQRNYAPNLAALGIDPRSPKSESAEHAGLLDENLGNESCTGDAWCTKSGYHFRVRAICKLHKCDAYLTVATPANDNTGVRSFCSTSDGIIRYRTGSSSTVPATVSECKTWSPLK